MFAEVLTVLLELGADIEAENNEGETPIFSGKNNYFVLIWFALFKSHT